MSAVADRRERRHEIARLLAPLSAAGRRQAIAAMNEVEVGSAAEAWDANWAHPGQSAPATCDDGSEWQTWVLMAGRGFGKTRSGAEWVAAAARGGGALRIALVAATLDEARRVMVEGASGLIAVAGADITAWSPSLRLLQFRSGAQATLFSGASPEMLRGPEHHIAWCDELAKWEQAGETWDMLQMGLRLGEHPRVLVTTTPRTGPVLTRIMAQPGAVVTGGATRGNPHLPAAFVDTVHALYAGTRLGRQELDGELLPDAAGALWTVELIERGRGGPHPAQASPESTLSPEGEGKLISPSPSPSPSGERVDTREARRGEGAPFTRTVIGVDPPSGDGTCGIIVCARDADGHAHVLADHSVTAQSPEGWARAVASAAEVHGADLIVAEVNQGGKMVEAVLRTAAPALRVKPVNARLGKSDRATPVSHLFEAGKVTLHGHFPALEAELCGLIAGGGYEGPGTSPDRADAMVWALSELMLKVEQVPRVRVM